MFKKIALTLITALMVIGYNSSEECEKLISARDIISEVSKEFVSDKRVAGIDV